VTFRAQSSGRAPGGLEFGVDVDVEGATMNIKQRKFFRKVMTGVKCHRSEKLRMFVLTESNEAIKKGYDFVLKFKHLIAFLRKKYGKFEYCCVLHRQGDKKRLNYHVLYFGSYIPQKVIDVWWFENYDSYPSKMELVRNPMQSARYISGYLDKQEKFVSAHFSNNWVFPGWWSFGKWYKHEYGSYPNDVILMSYSKMTKEQLDNDPWYSAFVNDLIKKGLRKPKNEVEGKGSKKPLYQRILKPGEYEIISIEKVKN
jgi:hypothetical protein